jgi:methylase of polypeptide subunit release factors
MVASWTQVLLDEDPLARLRKVAAALGFDEAARIDTVTRQAIGVSEEIEWAVLARGPGTTRLVGVVSPDSTSPREQAARIAHRLSRKAPHLLWLLALTSRTGAGAGAGADLVLAAWHAASGQTRIAALVVTAAAILPSDAESLESLKATLAGASDVEIHAQWLEVLGRESITRRFFQSLQRLVHQLGEGSRGGKSPDIRREFALLYVSRLLFLAFLEERGWLDGDRRFLVRSFDDCMAKGGRFQRNVLAPLFFGTLNTPVRKRAPRARALGRIPFLNGGLFTRTSVEKRARDLMMRDEDFGELFDQLLVRYRFTSREETADWQETAIDPEILGRAFESLMVASERRITGAFYTPLPIVTRVTDTALDEVLLKRGCPERMIERLGASVGLEEAESASLRTALDGLRVLDPACGSGAFLVHAMERLVQLRVASGDTRPVTAIRRHVLNASIFGVDVNPTAVWLCELRLWLSLVLDHAPADAGGIPPLPNIDHNIRCGDTLLGGDFALVARHAGDARAGALRTRYARATGARKRSLARLLERTERANLVRWLDGRLAQVSAQRRSLVVAARGRDLFGGRRGALAAEREHAAQLRTTARELRNRRRAVLAGGALPFVFAAHFPEAARDGGFDVIVGNPPWIRVHHIPVSARDALRREFRVYREAAWSAGAQAARAGSGFGSQIDVASLFVERSHQLLRDGGVLSLLVPSKLWRSLAGGGVRRLLMDRAGLLAVEDWSAAPAMFDAATYPSLVAASKSPTSGSGVRLAVHRGRIDVAWEAPRSELPLDDSAGAPWVPLPPDARRAFDRLTRDGIALVDAGLGVATLGVKCGCNEAFLVHAAGCSGGVEITDGSRHAIVEPQFVRRVLRGEAVSRWCALEGTEAIVFPQRPDGRPLERLPAGIRSWLLPWRSRLEARSDARGHNAWWSLFRLDGSRYDKPRVVWADLGRSLQALVLRPGDRTVPLNTCYVLPTRDLTDALALAALLNSPVADAWVGAVAEPARGGYRRHFAWTMARLPVPDDWARARDMLAPLGERALRGDPPSRSELMSGVLDAFHVRLPTIAPLIEWIFG